MSRYQPALLGGLFIGVLSALPVVNIANCCCLWVICGGVLTVYLQQQNLPTPVATSDAAVERASRRRPRRASSSTHRAVLHHAALLAR